MGHDEIIDALAATQHGVVARHQLLELGSTAKTIDNRLARGRLVPVYPGVYRVHGTPPSWPQRLQAACLAAGPGAIVSHAGAAYLHRLAGIPPRVEVTVGITRAPSPHGVVVHRTRDLPRPEVVEGLPRTKLARTLIDLATAVTPAALDVALCDALSRQLVTCAYLRGRIADLGTRGRKGMAALQRLLDEQEAAGERPQNHFERRLFVVLRNAGIRLPVAQFEVPLGDGRSAILDYAYPELRVALEADSYRYHSSKLDWSRDRIRNRRLTALGWRILPVTWQDLADPGPFLTELCMADPALGGQTRAV